MNLNSRKYAGFVNDKAVGILPIENNKGITVITKKLKNTQKPSIAINKSTIGNNKTTRKTYKTIANITARSGYRADLRPMAVSRASAIRYSQKPKKDAPEKKLRGSKLKKQNVEDEK